MGCSGLQELQAARICQLMHPPHAQLCYHGSSGRCWACMLSFLGLSNVTDCKEEKRKINPNFSYIKFFFSKTPSGHGRPRLWVMDVRTKKKLDFLALGARGWKFLGWDVRLHVRPGRPQHIPPSMQDMYNSCASKNSFPRGVSSWGSTPFDPPPHPSQLPPPSMVHHPTHCCPARGRSAWSSKKLHREWHHVIYWHATRDISAAPWRTLHLACGLRCLQSRLA